jgi:cytochrome c oxidase cbb3-type subunit IV
MDLIEFYPVLKSLWVVWFFLVFSGIVAWALWPSRRAKLQEYGSIPLRDTENR